MARKTAKKPRQKAAVKTAAYASIPPYLSLTFLVSFLLFYVAQVPIFTDPDTPWHIAAGQQIRELGHVPMTDSWAFADTQGKWLNLSWAWDVLISYIHDWFGLGGLFLFTCVWSASTITFLAWVLHKRIGEFNDAVMIALALAALTMTIQLGVRPQMMTELMAVLFLHLVHQSRAKRPAWLFLLLPFLMMVWANFHGGYLAGFVILGAYGLQAIFEKDKEWLFWLLWVGILSVPASFATPLGLDTFEATLRTLSSVIEPYIVEWRAMQFNISIGFDLFVIAMVLSSGFKTKTIPLAERLLAVLWFIAAIYSMRHLYLSLLLGSAYLARSLKDFLPHIRSYRFEEPWIGKSLVVAILVAVPVCALFPIRELMDRPRVIAEGKVPVEALEYIRKHYPGKRFLNDFHIGGYMIYYNRDVHQVYTDGRAGTVFSEDDLKELIDLIRGTNTGKILKKYKFDGVIAQPEFRVYNIPEIHDPTQWKKVFDDGHFMVYVRRELAPTSPTDPRP